MEKSNYALISALYSNSKRGLYSDIYFPIIKYAIVKIFSNREESHPYCSADKIQEFIVDKFGISIPLIVISKSVLKISAQEGDNLQLKVYENGNTFQIQMASFDIDNERIDEHEKLFTKKISIIEKKYKDFIEQEGSIDDGVTFVQFISDNTDDILGYFEKQDTSKVDEKYVTIVFFLQYLCDHEKDLFQIANQLFWGSIIAGFLKSDKPQIDDSTDGIKTEYFLDTSIVMGLLKLSTSQRESYSKEVCDIIKSTGGILRVHPMTVDEISYILQSVEQNGPNPLTDIASACNRYKLGTNELAQIRLKLSSIIEKEGINVFPIVSPTDKQKVIQSYQNKRTTILLGETRSKKPASYNSGNYREIHDIFMDDYIKERRKKKSDDNHVFFLTSNQDLIAFCKTMHPDVNHMKSTGRVILELWMHNTKPIDISGCMLTETMARCLDLHSTRVRNKIAEVSHFYNRTKNDFNAEVYNDFIKKLYRRAKHVIQTVETNYDENVEGNLGRLINEAVAADNLVYSKETAIFRDKNIRLTEDIAMKDEALLNVTEEKNRIFIELQNKERERELLEQAKQEETIAKEKAERINTLYKKRDELKDKIEHIGVEIVPYKKSLEKSFCNWEPLLFFFLCALIIIILSVLWYKLYMFDSMPFFKENKGAITSGLLTIAGGFFLPLGIHFLSKESIKKRKAKAINKWESRNTQYTKLNSDLSRYKKELEDIENQLYKY